MTAIENGLTTPTEANQCKLPYNRIKFSVDRIVATALPLHVQLLEEKSHNLQLIKSKESFSSLRAEQIKAANCMKLLKADIYELQDLFTKVEDIDQDLFCRAIREPIEKAVEAISNFTELHPNADEPIPNIGLDRKPDFPKLVCHLDQECESPSEDQRIVQAHLAHPLCNENSQTLASALPDWTFLRKELLEIHGLITRFASYVLTQKESVDNIQSNVEQAHENVQEGVHYLKKASVLKAATLPLFGAILGGAVLGPVGMLVGFKLVGTAACVASGGALGYKAAATLKKKHEISADIEMKALTYTSKEKSSSDPELSIAKYQH